MGGGVNYVRREMDMHRGMKNNWRLWTAALGLLVAACGDGKPAEEGVKHDQWGTYYSWRMKLTIDVQTADGVRSGSSVIAFRKYQPDFDKPGISPHAASKSHLDGEAVHVDLGQGRHLFAIMRMETWRKAFGEFDKLLETALEERLGRVPGFKELRETKERYALKSDALPEMVRFSNLHASSSYEFVSAQKMSDVFGADVKFLGAWIEATTDPITEKITKTLPWLPYEYMLRGPGKKRFCDPRKEDCLSGLDFYMRSIR
jgi:hypothetical protein